MEKEIHNATTSEQPHTQKTVLIVGSGISGLTCAIEIAKAGHKAILAAPYSSERAQSVMAAGGINGVLNNCGEDDTIALHIEETMKGGCDIASYSAVERLCQAAPHIIAWLESLGMVFTRDEKGNIDQRAFGGQSKRRTAYAGASTGKQIVSALVQQARKYECQNLIERRKGHHFYSALIEENDQQRLCRGALFYNEFMHRLEVIYADSVVMATGGQNALFGKTTGSTLCDGYAIGKLFTQGVAIKNPEFIQYHPTTIETAQKRMLVTEGARGDGGRLYYMDGDRRVYFMEDKYGEKGNLMPRDIVSKCIAEAPSQVYLDISFLDKNKIRTQLSEVEDLCLKYINLDVTKESIPVAPSVHFFMGGLAVDVNHRTNVERLYGIGECASQYHGANRLGGNSLLAAIHSGKIAAQHITESNHSPLKEEEIAGLQQYFDGYIELEKENLEKHSNAKGDISVLKIRHKLADIMQKYLSISRNAHDLEKGLQQIEILLQQVGDAPIDLGDPFYKGYTTEPMLILAKAILTAALSRQETRGAHIRTDYPLRNDEKYQASTIVEWKEGQYAISYIKEDEPCR